MALLMVLSVIGAAGCGRVSGSSLKSGGVVSGEETAVPEEAGGRSTPVDSAGSECGTDISVNDEDEITESDFKNHYQAYCEASISKFLQLNWGENPRQGAVLYSPVNLYMALGMLSEMSDGETRQQLQDGLSGLDEETSVKNHMCVSVEEQKDKGDGRQTMIRQTSQWLYGKADSGVCSFGNSVWFSDRYDFSDSVKDILKNNYNAQCDSGRMGDPAFDEKIQKWLDHQTGGKLCKEISSNIKTESDMAMMLLSAVNFKDEWEEPIFDRKDTRKDTFYGRNYYTCGNTTEEEKLDKVTCDFMNTSWNGLCMENKRFQAVSIPMKNTRMTLVLPGKGVSFDQMSSAENIKEIIELCDPECSKWKQGLVKLSLPKLQFQSDMDIIPMLQKMGIKDAFRVEKADFGRIWKNKDKETSVPDLYVSKARQAGVVKVEEDARECVNDTWLQTWNAIPPKRPAVLPGFLAKIIRNLSLNRYRHMHTKRRGGNSVDIALEELQDCVTDGRTVEEQIELKELSASIAKFLNRQSERNRAIFLQRYFYMMPTKEIAEKLGMREGTVRSTLSRMRKDLKGWLEKEAVYL